MEELDNESRILAENRINDVLFELRYRKFSANKVNSTVPIAPLRQPVASYGGAFNVFSQEESNMDTMTEQVNNIMSNIYNNNELKWRKAISEQMLMK